MPPVAADPLGRWLTAVALGGQGRYAAAWAVLGRLLIDPAVPAAIVAHAAVTRASHLRQVGGHAAARHFDALALRRAVPSPAPPARTEVASVRPSWTEATPVRAGRDGGERDGTGIAAARIDALIGLAADAVGLGDPAGALRLLAGVQESVREHPHPWRLHVRWGWVRAELALLLGRPGEAVDPAAAALAEAVAGGSRRHELKSRIVLAVARAAADAGAAGAAVEELTAVENECAECGLLPLQWPAALAAADLLDRDGARENATGRRHAAHRTLDVLYSRSDPIGKLRMRESMWQPAQSTVV